MVEIYIRPTRASKPPVFCMLERGGIITGTVLLSCQHLPSDIKVSLNLPTLSHLPHTQDTVCSFYMSNVIYILTSLCSTNWGDCGGVITCSLHTSSSIPSSSGGGNGTLARGGTSTASWKIRWWEKSIFQLTTNLITPEGYTFKSSGIHFTVHLSCCCGTRRRSATTFITIYSAKIKQYKQTAEVNLILEMVSIHPSCFLLTSNI